MAKRKAGKWRAGRSERKNGSRLTVEYDYLINNRLQGGVFFDNGVWVADSLGFAGRWGSAPNLPDAKAIVEAKVGKGLPPEGFLCIGLDGI